ncbi:protein-disulfide reductase DsbD domain-containing protein [Salinarimonas ramus]|uniref:Protein involved in C cytochrome biogenesis n=1 Tax=Salinarimonas ramus TaxID=690164 RepID=A0A917Q4X7_9HYPH|nr:protein-disulfide reductase DsbD domain-containing protein [Salinarimonas ramus]GGK25102.1 protein involved in C cytochrome biogenesis [Salinarimonas ramus]
MSLIPSLLPNLLLAAATFALVGVVAPGAEAAPTGASQWSDDHASRARLVSGDAVPQERWAGIEIEMEAGYKTYWRTPGDSGIPAELDWSGSQNVADVEVLWPAPARFEDPFGFYYGYLEHVVVPVKVTPEDPARPATLSLSLFYGVCKEICIPATADVSLTLPPEPAASTPAVAQALATVPEATPLGETEGPLAILDVSPTGEDTLAVRVRAPRDAMLLAEGPDGSWFLAASEAADAEGVFSLDVVHRPRGAQGPFPLRLTLIGADAAIEVETSALLD